MAVTNKNDRWFLVDTTHPSYARMKNEARSRHKARWPHARLSITLNLAGTEALVKVRGARGWAPSWRRAPMVQRVFTPADHDEAQAMVRTPLWEDPALE